MSISRPTSELKKFDVIRSNHFNSAVKQVDGSFFVGRTADGDEPYTENAALKRVDWYVVQDSHPLRAREGVLIDASWEVTAVKLINGDIDKRSEMIHFFAGGRSEARIDEVEVIGTAVVAEKPTRWGRIDVKVTLVEGAAASIAARYYFMTNNIDPGYASFNIVEKRYWKENEGISDTERGDELRGVLPPGFQNASEAEFHYYEKGEKVGEASAKTKEKARQLLLAAGFEQIDNPEDKPTEG
jgi:hypothetical protein